MFYMNPRLIFTHSGRLGGQVTSVGRRQLSQRWFPRDVSGEIRSSGASVALLISAARVLAPNVVEVWTQKEEVRKNREWNQPSYVKERKITEAQESVGKAIQDSSKYKDEDKYRPFLWNTRLEYRIEKALRESRAVPGVIVVLAPSGAGKSTRARTVARKLTKEGHLRGCVYVEFVRDGDPSEQFFAQHGCHDYSPQKVCDIIPATASNGPPLLFILDQLDGVADHDKLLKFLLRLAIESNNNLDQRRDFVVMAIFSQDVNLARSVVELNNRRKIRPLTNNGRMIGEHGYKWTRVECKSLIDMFTSEEHCEKQVADKNRKELGRIGQGTFLDLAERAGTPTFIRDFFEVRGQPAQDIKDFAHL